ncbi:hypothetical protein TWF970_006873 [Orbilia oligospora]|uniref:Uncharacterized protein n=1 Tax=Orbilia oligospora TaxID=2813651 RepID=A0A7C8R7I4_ORBOL|nr:hypothetical protein TWF970_006873 [Orbilia oligospora]
MSTPQPIPPRLTPSATAAQRSTPSPSLPVGSPRPPTAGSLDPPTPRPSQLPFPGISSTEQPSTSFATVTITTDDSVSTQQPPNQQPAFLPFFTLIQDATTSSHFHPTVRYVFSDDEFDPLAILPGPPPAHSPSAPNSLSNSAAANQAPGTNTGGNNSGSGSQADVDSNSSGHFSKPGGSRGGRYNERVVLVDVAADGQGILSAHSLSPEWQVSGVSVTKAPTWMSDGDGVGKGKRKLPGTGGIMDPVTKEKKGSIETLEELVGFYQERLERLQGVVDWAEGRKVVEGHAAPAAGAPGEGVGS